MTRYQAAKIMPAQFSSYKHLTVGDILPDATTKLYKRLFVSDRKKYIPVKDITKDRAGRELNAYLINPDFIDKATLPGEEIVNRMEAKPAVRAIRYSALPRLEPDFLKTNLVSGDILARLAGSTVLLPKKIILGTRQIVDSVRNISITMPVGKVYSASAGLTPRWRRHMLVKLGAIALVIGGALAFAPDNNTISPDKQPTSAVSQPSEASSSTPTPTSIPVTEGEGSPNNSTPVSSPAYIPEERLVSPRQAAPAATPTPSSTTPQQQVSPPVYSNQPVTIPVQPSPQPVTNTPDTTQSPDGLNGTITDVTNGVVDTANGLLGN